MICYIILHFNNYEITIQCINSLRKVITSQESQIIIVDNGSQNDSYKILKSTFDDIHNIKIIKAETNLGFAKGNNLGYSYAKKTFHPNLIVVCNNDLIFEQNDFEKKLLNIYEQYNFDLAGPDITNMDGIHQNPHRNQMLSVKDIRKMNRHKYIFLLYLKAKLHFPLLKKINILEKKFDQPGKTDHLKMIENMNLIPVLQGSCIIFTQRYIAQEDNAFLPDTFLYFEEDLLALRCKEKGYVIRVCPEITVKHLEGKSTCHIVDDDIRKRIFSLSYMLESGRIYEQKILNMHL